MRRRLAVAAALAATLACGKSDEKGAPPVVVRAGIDHRVWDDLLQNHVDRRGLVDYQNWKANPYARQALARYLGSLAAPAQPPATGEELQASLINAYNALTIDWVLDNYPTESIQSLEDPFTQRRHTVGGRKVSLDDIEHATLRPLAGYRVHGALVCAARSCPPLRREAYTAERLDAQLDRAMREWLDREDLNRFDVARGKARISPIFRWYAEDFEKVGGLRSALKKHSRGDVPRLFDRDDLDIDYVSYDWGLNDQGERGRRYSGLRAWWDRVR